MRTKIVPCKIFSPRKIAGAMRSVFLLLACASAAAGGAAVLLGMAGCNEFVEDDPITDTPRRPRLADGALTTLPATRAAVTLSPADQQRADEAIAALQKENDRKKLMTAMKVVTDLEDSRAASALMSIARDKRLSPDDREFVDMLAESLARTRSADVSAELVAMIKNAESSGRQREIAASLLERIRDPRAVTPLIELMQGDKESPGAFRAVEILGHIGGEDAIKALVESTRRPSRDEQWHLAVCKSLAIAPNDSGMPALLALWTQVQSGNERENIVYSLMGKRDPAVEAIAKEALNKRQGIRVERAALQLLVSIESSEAWPALVAALKDDAAILRLTAVNEMSLSKVAAAHEAKYLQLVVPLATSDEYPIVRAAAVSGIAYHVSASPRDVVAACMAALADKNATVRTAAAGALAIGGKMKPGVGSAREIAAQLTKALADDNWEVSGSAAASLLTFGEKETVRAYLEKARTKLEDFKGENKTIYAMLKRIENSLQKSPALAAPALIVDEKGELLKGPV